LYWLVMLSYQAFGVSEASARLVPALAVHATILLVYLIGRRSVGERSAFWAAVLLTVAPLFIGVARLLLMDGLLTMFVTASLLTGFEAVRTGRFQPGWWVASAVASGLGFLTKGPISELLLFPPLFLFAWLGGRTARVGVRSVLLFGAIVLAVNLPWYVAVYRREPVFLKYFFWDHNVMRFLQPFDHLQPVWYYAPILLLGLLPTTLLLVPYLRHMLTGNPEAAQHRTAAAGFWLLAGGWCVLFFTVSGSKLPTYILPAFPPLCLALGDYLYRSGWYKAAAARTALPAMACLLFAVHFVGLPWYAKMRSPVGRPELVFQHLAEPGSPVACYPRDCNSVAFYSGRADLRTYRSKDVNHLILAMQQRPRTVVLFTHRHSLEAFRYALPPALEVTETTSLRHGFGKGSVLGWLVGETPWGLCDVAVIETRSNGPRMTRITQISADQNPGKPDPR
jgi:hypothetical protein